MAHRILTSLVGIDATFSSTLSLTSLAGVGNRMLIVDSAGTVSTQAIPTGTVTSVGLSMPSAFTVTNSPVTGAGTLTVTGAGTTAQYIDGTGALQTLPTSTSRVQHQVKAGVAISKGQAVYVTSADGTNMIVGLASNTSEATSSKTMGLLDATVSTNGFANVVTEGLLAGLDTSAAGSAGDPVWLGANGNLLYGVANKPSAPLHMVFIGVVTRKNQNNGEIFVKVQNGFELEELHNVAISSIANKNLLMYEAATSLWKNSTLGNVIGGISTQYVKGDGTLGSFPNIGGGGGLVYYLNGSISGSAAGYYQMSKTPVFGTGTDFSLTGNGLIVQFITDTNDPSLLSVPSGAWRFGLYASMGTGGNSSKFYVEIYKYDGTTFTLIGSSSSTPESVVNGTAIEYYTTTVAVATVTLAVTDRIAVRVYATDNNTRTMTIHTENSHLCDVATTFPTGISAINGLITPSQYLSTTTTGTDFTISSTTNTHYFNLPVASSTVTGKLSSTDWTTFNNKQNALTNPITGTGTANYLPKFTGSTALGNSLVYDDGTFVGIGTASPSAKLQTAGSLTASGAIARGVYFNNTLVAAANNDVLVGLDITPTFTNGIYTGVTNLGLRVNSGVSSFGGNVIMNGNNFYLGGNLGNTVIRTISTTNVQIFNNNSGATLFLDANGSVQIGQSSATNWALFSASGHTIYNSTNTYFFSTGNIGINQSSDAGYKLDVGGTTRFQGNITQSSGSATFANGILLDSTSRIFSSGTITYQSNNTSSQHLFKNDISSSLSGTIVTISNSSGAFGTTSASNFLNITGRLATASGTNNLTSILLNHTVENTGTYTGTIRGIYYNPSSIVGTGFTHRAIETTTGDVLFGTTSGVVGIGTTTIGTEANLYLGAKSTTEGGQLILQKGTSQTYATHLDNYTDQFRVMYGTDTGSSGIALAVSMSTRQLILPAYTTTSSFSGTVVGYLAFDSSGNVLTVAAPGGSVNSVSGGTGVTVSPTTGNVVVSIGQSVATSATPSFDQVFATNNGNGTNFKVGDDAWIGDVNTANALRVMGQQNAANGYIIFGNSDFTALGRAGTGALTYGGYTIYHSNNSNTITALGTITTGVWNGTAITDTYISSASTWNAKQNALTLTTTGTSGAATLVGATLNIPQYQSVLTNPVTGTGSNGQVTYWNGTNSVTGSSTFAFTPTSQLLVNNSVTASGAIAKGINLTPTLIAAANNDVLVGLDVNPTYTNGSFTGLSNLSAKFTGNVLMGQVPSSLTAYSYVPLTLSNNATGALKVQLALVNGGGSANAGSAIDFYTYTDAGNGNPGLRIAGIDDGNYSGNFQIITKAQGSSGSGLLSTKLQIFGGTGNVIIQNGGTFTDAGYKLDVNGTARINSTLSLTNSSFAGTFNFYLSAANTMLASSSNIGTWLQVGGGNNVYIVGQAFNSTARGNSFGNTVGGEAISATTIIAQSSGTTATTGLSLRYTINNTGTYVGTTRGIYYNPTVTSLTGTTHYAIETVVGDLYFGSTSGKVGMGIAPSGTDMLSLGGHINLGAHKLYNGAASDSAGLWFNSNVTNISGYSGISFRSSAAGIQTQSIRMSIFPTGNVAVGTTTDAGYMLDVAGTARVQSTLTVGSTGNSGTINLARASTGGTAGAIIQTNDITQFYNYQGSGIDFYVAGGSTVTRAFVRTTGIGITGTSGGNFTMDASAALQINSTIQGFLPPRMTVAQRTSISSPATGLVVYQTDSVEGLYVYTSSGWKALTMV